jgi:DNA-3-methyladenine glycosylase II
VEPAPVPPSKPRPSPTAPRPKIIVTGEHTPADPWAEGVDFLRNLDPKWADIIARVGPCRLQPRPDRFGTLVRAIIGQQISAKAASSVDRRLRELCGEPHAPAPLLAIGEGGLRTVGLSGVKARYVLNLSKAVHDGDVPLDEIHEWDDERIVAALTSIKGVGPWTAEMFLIFALGRPDVLSVGDLGIRVGLRDYYGLAELPGPREAKELAEPWRPHRTVAMWYLWELIDNPPPDPDPKT